VFEGSVREETSADHHAIATVVEAAFNSKTRAGGPVRHLH
jgi:hypothetical protein